MVRTALIFLLIWLWAARCAADEDIRVAVYNLEMERDGPGLLLRDIRAGEDPQIAAAARVIAHVAPDVLLLLRFDYDHDLLAISAFAEAIRAHGHSYRHVFALRPNSGRPTGFDIDGDGRSGNARDAQGYGRFSGQGGMAILSRLPIATQAARDFSGLLWRDLPGATLPRNADGTPFFATPIRDALRLASVAHWDVPVRLGDGGLLHLWAFHAETPVFDGPEDRNGLRNRDQIRFWQLYMDGALDILPPAAPFVLLGDANLDPARGEGRREAIGALLADARLTDPRPESPEAARLGGGSDTADWPEENGPGNLRVDYVLPSADLEVTGAGVLWPGDAGDPALTEAIRTASRHRLVWVDLRIAAPPRP